MLNGLDLFSGIGGLSIALSEWVRPVAYCEIDTYCQGVLLSAMQRQDISSAPLWNDITTLDGQWLRGDVDIIYGGFPCQGISVAGLGKGLADERSGLFWEIVRLAKEIKPKFIFIENVPAITSRGGLTVVRALTEMGYDCRWCVISAASVGALHKRERWFLLGYSQHSRWNGSKERGSPQASVHTCKKGKDEASESTGAGASTLLASESIPDSMRPRGWQDLRAAHGDEGENGQEHLQQFVGLCPEMADTNSQGCDEEQRGKSSGLCKKHAELADGSVEDAANASSLRCDERPSQGIHSEWGAVQHEESRDSCNPWGSIAEWQEAVSSVCRTSNGIPFHVHRLRALGNAVVPVQAKEAFQILMGLK